MPHRIEQPTLFELTVCDESEPPRGLPLSDGAPDVAPRSDLAASEANAPQRGRRSAGLFHRGRACHSMRSAPPVGARSPEVAT